MAESTLQERLLSLGKMAGLGAAVTLVVFVVVEFVTGSSALAAIVALSAILYLEYRLYKDYQKNTQSGEYPAAADETADATAVGSARIKTDNSSSGAAVNSPQITDSRGEELLERIESNEEKARLALEDQDFEQAGAMLDAMKRATWQLEDEGAPADLVGDLDERHAHLSSRLERERQTTQAGSEVSELLESAEEAWSTARHDLEGGSVRKATSRIDPELGNLSRASRLNQRYQLERGAEIKAARQQLNAVLEDARQEEEIEQDLKQVCDLLAEGRSCLANEAYTDALQQATEGLDLLAEVETRNRFESDDEVRKLRADLRELKQTAERRQGSTKQIEAAREQRAAAERALSVGDLKSAKTAIDKLRARVEALEDHPEAAEIRETTTQLERALGTAQADAEADELVASIDGSLETAEQLLDEANYSRAESRLDAAAASLDSVASLNSKHGLGRESMISAKRDRIDSLFEQCDPTSKAIEAVRTAETQIAAGIEHRDATRYAEALDAFETAQQHYETAADVASGLDQQWEIEERRSMVESYVAIVQDELEEHRQSVHTNLEKQLAAAARTLDQATQYTEVDDYVTARESLGSAVLALDEATQLLELNRLEAAYQEEYDKLVERANMLHQELPEEADTGEYSTQELVDSLQRLATKLTESPRPEFLNAYGEYPAEAYLEAFGSWPEALAAANLEPVDEAAHERRKYSRVEVLDAIVECARTIGHPPDRSEMNKHGRMSASPVLNRFRDWESALDLAGLSDGEVPPEPAAPEPNELADLYDMFKTLSTLLAEYIEADSGYQLGDGSPLAEWQAALEGRWTGEGTPGRPVYGLQQAKRNSFAMSEYRSAYGNGSRVTAFSATDTQPLSEQARQRLIRHGLIEAEESLSVPVAPESGTPLQLFVESEGALSAARSLLDEFPAFPAADLSQAVLEVETEDEAGDREEGRKSSEKMAASSDPPTRETPSSESSSDIVDKLLGDMGFNDTERETAND